MGQPYDELLYSLIISQLKDDGFIEEAESLQRKVVSFHLTIFVISFLQWIIIILKCLKGYLFDTMCFGEALFLGHNIYSAGVSTVLRVKTGSLFFSVLYFI